MNDNLLNYVLVFQFIIILLLIFSIYFCIIHYAACRLYWAFAKNVTAIFIILEIFVFLKKGTQANVIFFFAPYHFISIALFSISGLILTRRLSLPGLPMITSLGRRITARTRSYIKSAPIMILSSSFIICFFTYILFKWSQPEISDFFKSRVTEEGEFSVVAEVSFISILFFCLVAFFEEVVFRLFTQNFLMFLFRKFSFGPILSILLTAAFFAFGHFGVLADWHIKIFQTFVVGLILSWVMYRNGMESSFLVHCVLNIYALYASESLLIS